MTIFIQFANRKSFYDFLITTYTTLNKVFEYYVGHPQMNFVHKSQSLTGVFRVRKYFHLQQSEISGSSSDTILNSLESSF